MKLKKLPTFLSYEPIKIKKLNKRLRDYEIKIKSSNSFEKFCFKFIYQNLPMSALENFSLFSNHPFNLKCKSLNYIVSNYWALNDIYKLHLAINKNSNKIFLQHGGVYGHIKYNISENCEIEICDHFLTWGWNKIFKNKFVSKKNSNKIIDFYSLAIKKKFTSKNIKIKF